MKKFLFILALLAIKINSTVAQDSLHYEYCFLIAGDGVENNCIIDDKGEIFYLNPVLHLQEAYRRASTMANVFKYFHYLNDKGFDFVCAADGGYIFRRKRTIK